MSKPDARVVVQESEHMAAIAVEEKRYDALRVKYDALQARLDAVGRLPDEWLAAVRKNGVYDEFDSGLNAARTSDANELRAALGGESPGNEEVR